MQGRNRELILERVYGFYYGCERFKVITIGCINLMNIVVHHRGNEKEVKYGLGLGLMFFYKRCKSSEGLYRRGNDLDIFLGLIEIDKLGCLSRRQGMLNPSFVGYNGVKLDKVLDGDGSLDLAVYGPLHNCLAFAVKRGVFVIGVNEDVGINQACGQDILHRGRLSQKLPFLYDRDGMSGLLHDEASSLPLPASLSSSGTRQSPLPHGVYQVVVLLRCLISSVVRHVAACLLSLSVLNLAKEPGGSQGYCEDCLFC